MTVDFQVTRFQKDSSGTNGATQDVSLNFTPKAIWAFHAAHTADDTFAEVLAGSYGFSDGTNQACVSYRSRDNQATSDTGGAHRDDSCVAMQNTGTPATTSIVGSAAFGTNKVTFTWTVNDTNPLWIYVVAVAGSDIQNVKVNTVDVAKNTSTGTENYTGLGFNPTGNGESILFTLNSHATALNVGTSNCSPHLGVATSDTKRWVVANVLEDARAAADTWRYFSSSKCLAILDAATGVINTLADFNAWITDGFQLDYEDAPPATNLKFSYMVINGGKWDVGTEATRTTPGTETTTVDSALVVIRGVGIAGHVTTTVDSVIANSAFSLGVADNDGGTIHQGWMAFLERTALDPTQNISRHSSNNRFNAQVLTGASSPFTPSMPMDSTLQSFGTNEFTIDYTVGPGAAYPCGWWAVGDSGVVAVAAEPPSNKSFGTIGITNAGNTIFG